MRFFFFDETFRNAMGSLYRSALVLSVGLAVYHSVVSGEWESALERCCNVGSSWGTNQTTCTGPPHPIPGIQPQDRSVCLTAIYICCIRMHRHLHCEQGKQVARSGQTCSLLPTLGGEAHKDCCDACALGLKAASRRIPCTFLNFRFDSPWSETYDECCHSASPNPGTSPLTERNKASCGPNHPCSQLCHIVGNTIQCSCHAGYRLASDQRTCEDVNECVLGTHTCNPATESCFNIMGGFQCLEKAVKNVIPGQCPAGYVRKPGSQTCDDIDECASGVCPPNQVCTNTVGSFICLPHSQSEDCPRGFRRHQTTGRCIDVDECAEGTDECDHALEFCLNSHGGYLCQPKPAKSKECPAGFKWSDESGICQDVDECAENTDSCNEEVQNCFNEIGSYRCVPKVPACPHGYRKDSSGTRCEDINECFEGIDDCDKTRQYCVNTIGSFQCHTKTTPPVHRCGNGYKKDPVTGTCIDINECEELAPCGPDQTCENSFGSYRCFCQQGYTLDTVNKICKDVNECQLGLHNCGPTQRCDNTIGSFICVRTTSCGTGYTLNADTQECEDDDECALGTHNCGQGFACRNIQGSFRCDRVKCPEGQKLLADGTCKLVNCNPGMQPDANGNCIDINECAIGNVCRRNQRCINTVGSYLCQNLLNCGIGYEMNEIGNQCIDVDECARGIHECGPQQSCRNHPGSYSCECPIGFTLNADRQCEDVDECARFRGQVCSITSECQNTPGSYICNCKEGFRKAEDGKYCIDVDECAESPGICHQTCVNVWGSYQCSCNQGYTLGPDGRTCQDIDECSLYEGRGNLCIGLCVNEPGSYSCACPDGYRLSNDKRTCQDIDECREHNVCKGENEVCLNTRGSFKCNMITCPPNYVRDREHRNRCKRPNVDCRPGDSECLKDPLTYSYNYITFVSNMRIPPTGQLDLFTMRGPRFTFTSVQFSLELKSARTPEGIPQATRDNFHLRRTAFNEAMVSLVKTISGPQEIELDLIMKMYHNGLFGGSAVAKIFIYVTQHEF